MAMVQRPDDLTPGTPAGDARAAVVTGLSLRAAERAVEAQIETYAHLMSDEAKAFMAIGESFAKHETVKHPAANTFGTPSTSIRSRVSIPASAAPLPVSFTTSVRSMPTCISTRSAFAGPSASFPATQFGKPGMAWKS
jgi:ISXO2-like transposase domain